MGRGKQFFKSVFAAAAGPDSRRKGVRQEVSRLDEKGGVFADAWKDKQLKYYIESCRRPTGSS